jgi:hypothetical protein
MWILGWCISLHWLGYLPIVCRLLSVLYQHLYIYYRSDFGNLLVATLMKKEFYYFAINLFMLIIML